MNHAVDKQAGTGGGAGMASQGVNPGAHPLWGPTNTIFFLFHRFLGSKNPFLKSILSHFEAISEFYAILYLFLNKSNKKIFFLLRF